MDRIVLKARRYGREVKLVSLNAASQTMMERHAVHDKEGAVLAGRIDLMLVMIRNNLGFLRDNLRWIAAGFLLTLFSSFGQTFFIGLFAIEIRSRFHLSGSAFGGLYMVATLASAATLPWLGRTLDVMPGWKVVRYTMQMLAVACVLMPLAMNAVVLVLALVHASAVRPGHDDGNSHDRDRTLVRREPRTRHGDGLTRSTAGHGGIPDRRGLDRADERWLADGLVRRRRGDDVDRAAADRLADAGRKDAAIDRDPHRPVPSGP